jgi:hypothetical protein
VWFVGARGCFAGATACAAVGVGVGTDWVVVLPAAAAVAVVVATVLAAALAAVAVAVGSPARASPMPDPKQIPGSVRFRFLASLCPGLHQGAPQLKKKWAPSRGLALWLRSLRGGACRRVRTTCLLPLLHTYCKDNR